MQPASVPRQEGGGRVAFSTANRTYEAVFGRREKKDSELYRDFMDMLGAYLKEEGGEPARKMREWISFGKELDALTCRQDLVEPLCDNLLEAGIPFIAVNETTGKTGLLIRACDVQPVKKTVKKTLGELAGHCTICSGYDAGMHYLRGRDEDKTMLLLGGLSREEAFCFVESCGQVIPGETVGIDHMPDGTYVVSVHARTVMRPGRKTSFPGALAETIILINGETGEARERTGRRILYLQKKSDGFPDREGTMKSPVWIVGTGTCFVKKALDGFEAGHAVVLREMVFLKKDYEVIKEDKKYKERLDSALSRMTDHKCLYTEEDVREYYKKPGKTFRPHQEKGQHMVVEQAAALVMRKTATDRIMRMDGKWEHKFRHVQKNLACVLEAAAEGKVPGGYAKTDIIALRSTAKACGIDLKEALPGIRKYARLDSYAREAGIPRVADLDKLIEKYTLMAASRDKKGERETGRHGNRKNTRARGDA